MNNDYKTVRSQWKLDSLQSLQVSTDPKPESEAEKSSKTGLIVVILLLLLVGLIVGAWYLYDRKRKRDQAMKTIVYNEIEK